MALFDKHFTNYLNLCLIFFRKSIVIILKDKIAQDKIVQSNAIWE